MDIRAIAEAYNLFQQAIGVKRDSAFEDIPTLFSPSFTKQANGMMLVTERSHLKSQLVAFRDQAEKWDIEVHDILPFQNPRKGLIRYTLTSPLLGSFYIMAIVKANEDEEIEEI